MVSLDGASYSSNQFLSLSAKFLKPPCLLMRRCRYHHRLRIEQHFHTGFCPERRQRNDWRLDHRRERSVNAPDTRTRFFDDRISVPHPRHFEQSLSATFFRPNSDSTKRQLARRPFMRGFSVRCGEPDRSYWLGLLPAQSGTIHISPWLCPRVGDLIRLPAGAYTAIVSGAAGGMGVGLVEVFELD